MTAPPDPRSLLRLDPDWWDKQTPENRERVLRGALLMSGGRLCGSYEKRMGHDSSPQGDLGDTAQDRIEERWAADDERREQTSARRKLTQASRVLNIGGKR